jgi:hypothetical protein
MQEMRRRASVISISFPGIESQIITGGKEEIIEDRCEDVINYTKCHLSLNEWFWFELRPTHLLTYWMEAACFSAINDAMVVHRIKMSIHAGLS